MKIVRLNNETREDALRTLVGRSPEGFPEQEKTVADIIRAVRTRGDEAVLEYEERFDHCRMTPETLRVTREEIEAAYNELDPEFIAVMKRAAENIRRYHEKQKVNSWLTMEEDGILLGQKITPIYCSG